MLTYLSLSLPFIIGAVILDTLILRTFVVKRKDCWLIMTILLLLTAIFDQLLAGLPIVLYDDSKTLGVQLGYAPIEDFLYTFAAVIGIGSLVTYWSNNEEKSPKT